MVETRAPRLPSGCTAMLDDDPPPNLSIGSVTLAEGTGGSTAFAFTVTLSAVSGRAVTVGYATADGNATAADYAAASGTLAFAPGETTKTVTVQVTVPGASPRTIDAPT